MKNDQYLKSSNIANVQNDKKENGSQIGKDVFLENTLNRFYMNHKKSYQVAHDNLRKISIELQKAKLRTLEKEKEAEDLRKLVSERDAEVRRFQVKLANVENQVKCLKSEMELVKENKITLEVRYDKKMQTFQEENNSLKSSLEKARKTIKDLTTDLNNKTNQISALHQEIENANEVAKLVRTELSDNNKSMEKLQEQMKKDYDQLLQEYEEKTSDLVKEVDKKQKEIAEKISALAEKDKIIQNQAAKISQIERTLVQPFQRVSANVKSISVTDTVAEEAANPSTSGLSKEANSLSNTQANKGIAQKRTRAAKVPPQKVVVKRKLKGEELMVTGKRSRLMRNQNFDSYSYSDSDEEEDVNVDIIDIENISHLSDYDRNDNCSDVENVSIRATSESNVDPFEKLKNL